MSFLCLFDFGSSTYYMEFACFPCTSVDSPDFSPHYKHIMHIKFLKALNDHYGRVCMNMSV